MDFKLNPSSLPISLRQVYKAAKKSDQHISVEAEVFQEIDQSKRLIGLSDITPELAETALEAAQNYESLKKIESYIWFNIKNSSRYKSIKQMLSSTSQWLEQAQYVADRGGLDKESRELLALSKTAQSESKDNLRLHVMLDQVDSRILQIAASKEIRVCFREGKTTAYPAFRQVHMSESQTSRFGQGHMIYHELAHVLESRSRGKWGGILYLPIKGGSSTDSFHALFQKCREKVETDMNTYHASSPWEFFAETFALYMTKNPILKELPEAYQFWLNQDETGFPVFTKEWIEQDLAEIQQREHDFWPKVNDVRSKVLSEKDVAYFKQFVSSFELKEFESKRDV